MFEPETSANAQQPRPRRFPAGHPRGRRHVGWRRLLGHGGAAQGRGLRRRRRHAAALRPWRRDHRKGACCAGQDIYDARAVAERIGIPHYVLDYESRFKEMVIDRFAESYVAGETPVPCIECNQSIKFRDLLATARELGAKVLATG